MRNNEIKEGDTHTIVLLLRRGKNRLTVDWTLKYTNVSINISTYELQEELPKELLDALPAE